MFISGIVSKLLIFISFPRYFLDEWRFERNDVGEDKLRNVIEQYALCFTILRLSNDTLADTARRAPPRKEEPTSIKLEIRTLTGVVFFITIEPTEKVLHLEHTSHLRPRAARTKLLAHIPTPLSARPLTTTTLVRTGGQAQG